MKVGSELLMNNLWMRGERFRTEEISMLIEEFVNHEKADIEFKE